MFDSVSLIVKESNGEYRQEDEWTRQGNSYITHSTTPFYMQRSV